jgi:hypothetical protein
MCTGLFSLLEKVPEFGLLLPLPVPPTNTFLKLPNQPACGLLLPRAEGLVFEGLPSKSGCERVGEYSPVERSSPGRGRRDSPSVCRAMKLVCAVLKLVPLVLSALLGGGWFLGPWGPGPSNTGLTFVLPAVVDMRAEAKGFMPVMKPRREFDLERP